MEISGLKLEGSKEIKKESAHLRMLFTAPHLAGSARNLRVGAHLVELRNLLSFVSMVVDPSP